MVDIGGLPVSGTAGSGNTSPAGSQVTQQYCLKWNNHQNNLLRVFLRLLGQEMFTDVTIASEGRRIKCHKVVLSACSSYFEQLFMSFNEPNQIVILKDTPYQDIVAIIEFMYKGEINVSQDRLSSLLKTAENLKVKGLAEVSGGGGEEKKPSKTTTNNNNLTSSSNNSSNSNGLAADLTSQRSLLTSRLTGAAGAAGPPPMQMLGRSLPGGLLPDHLLNGDMKRKRGRPRTLDGPEDGLSTASAALSTSSASFHTPRISSVQGTFNPLLLAASQASTMTTAAVVAAQVVAAAKRAENAAKSDESPLKAARLALAGQSMSPLQAALNRPLNDERKSNTTAPSSPKDGAESNRSTPTSPHQPLTIKRETEDQPQIGATSSASSGGSDRELGGLPRAGDGEAEGGGEITGVTPERIASWGIIKMNDYLVTGTRQQYWEEIFVKCVMEAVRNKEVDMKGASELLGVSYGTLYGRYRENFGYLKHAWNLTGRPQRKQNLWTDPGTSNILEAMRSGTMSMKAAAEALGMEPAMLAYHLAAKVDPVPAGNGVQHDSDIEEEELDDDEDGAGIIIEGEDEEPDPELMEIQPEIIMGEADKPSDPLQVDQTK